MQWLGFVLHEGVRPAEELLIFAEEQLVVDMVPQWVVLVKYVDDKEVLWGVRNLNSTYGK